MSESGSLTRSTLSTDVGNQGVPKTMGGAGEQIFLFASQQHWLDSTLTHSYHEA